MKITNEIRVALLTSLIAFTSCSSDSEDTSSFASSLAKKDDGKAKEVKKVSESTAKTEEETAVQAEEVKAEVEEQIANNEESEQEENREIVDQVVEELDQQIEDRVQEEDSEEVIVADNSDIIESGEQDNQEQPVVDNGNTEVISTGDVVQVPESNEDQSQADDQSLNQEEVDEQEQSESSVQEEFDFSKVSEEIADAATKKINEELDKKNEEFLNKSIEDIFSSVEEDVAKKQQEREKEEAQAKLDKEKRAEFSVLIEEYLQLESPANKDDMLAKAVIVERLHEAIGNDKTMFDKVVANYDGFVMTNFKEDVATQAIVNLAAKIAGRDYCENILMKDKDIEELTKKMNFDTDMSYNAMADLSVIDKSARKMLLVKMTAYSMFHRLDLIGADVIFEQVSDQDVMSVEESLQSLFSANHRSIMHDIFSKRETLLTNHLVSSIRHIDMSQSAGIDSDLSRYFQSDVLMNDLLYIVEKINNEDKATEFEKGNVHKIISSIAGEVDMDSSIVEYLMAKAREIGQENAIYSNTNYQTIKALSKFSEGHEVLKTITGSEGIKTKEHVNAAIEIITVAERELDIASSLSNENTTTLRDIADKMMESVLGVDGSNISDKSFDEAKLENQESVLASGLSGTDKSHYFDKIKALDKKFFSK